MFAGWLSCSGLQELDLFGGGIDRYEDCDDCLWHG